MGNPLYLLGTSLARYRIWDGIRGLDYLASRPDVDPAQLGCVGNSGGGTLTAYIAALDPRVKAAAICCYITTLPRRMANRTRRTLPPTPSRTSSASSARGSTTRDCWPCAAPAHAGRLGPAGLLPDRRALGNRSPRRSDCTRSPAPAIGSRWPRRRAGMGSARRYGRPSIPGSTAGSPAGRMRRPRPRSPSGPVPTRSCSSARTARSTSR